MLFTDFTTDFKVVKPDRNLWDRIILASNNSIQFYMDEPKLFR